MLNVQLARKYSNAIFEIAQEEGKLEAYGEELKSVREGLESVPQAIAFLTNPQIETKTKKDLLKKLFDGELSRNVYHFLLLLVDKHRFALIGAIEDEYRALSNKARGILIADVTTASPASAAQQKRIREKLAQVTGKKVELRLHENAALIGGAVVKIGDRRIDGSVTGRLETMRKELLVKTM